MSAVKRQGNRPDRRVIPAGSVSPEEVARLNSLIRYTGSGLHKLHPGDYGFIPSHNPRPSKSPCDELRPVLLDEATNLVRRGLEMGMMSAYPPGSVPKYIWAVDSDRVVYEAKTKAEREVDYHGYRIGDDESEMRNYLLDQWRRRCPKG